jgi:hypothetical protein
MAVMVLGALWGREYVLPTLFWMILVGGGLGLALIVVRGELRDMLSRWWRSLWITLSSRRVTFFAASPGSAAGSGVPFAVAMGLGASIYQVWGVPWA